jgi:quercetin dioxygenase-like cupin family protein
VEPAHALKTAFAMPLTSPSYLVVTCRTGRAALEEAASGIGSEIAQCFKGAKVVIADLKKEAAKPTARDSTAAKERRSIMKKTALLLTAAAALFATSVAAQETIAPGANVSVVFDQELPNVPGKSMRAVLVEYGPGAGSPSHRHPSSAFIYARVLEGAIRSKVNDEPERTYKAGENWTEKPGDHHQVSHNASDTEPAKLLAIFVVDTGDTKIVIPDK